MGTQLLSTVLRRDRRVQVVEGSYQDSPSVCAEFDVALLGFEQACFNEELEIATALRAESEKCKIVILLDDPPAAGVVKAFRSGVRGIFCRSDSYKFLPKCVLKVHSGHIWATQRQIAILVDAIGQPFSMALLDAKGHVLLPKRQQQVVHWVAEGLTNREIAQKMGLSEHTVKNYLFAVFDRLGVSTRAELILYVFAKGFAQPRRSEETALSPPTVHPDLCPFEQLRSAERQVLPLLKDGAAKEYNTPEYQEAYLKLRMAEELTSVIRSRSRIALRDLETVLPPREAAQMRSEARARVAAAMSLVDLGDQDKNDETELIA